MKPIFSFLIFFLFLTTLSFSQQITEVESIPNEVIRIEGDLTAGAFMKDERSICAKRALIEIRSNYCFK